MLSRERAGKGTIRTNLEKQNVDETEGIDRFLSDFREAFTNYECYYRFDPYGENYFKRNQVSAIKDFSDAVIKWLGEHGAEENSVIQEYSVFFKKIHSFAVELHHVCDIVMEQ